jgi:hypothetical protein
MLADIATAEISYALLTLTRDDTPGGMFNPADEQERERLAVSLVREICDRTDRLTARDRAAARVASGVRVFAAGQDVSTYAQRLDFAAVIIADEQARNREPSRGAYAFYGSRAVNVNGVSLKLKWIA